MKSVAPAVKRDLPFHLALAAVRSALAPVAKAQSAKFVVTLVSPLKERLSDYAAAVEQYLIDHDCKFGLKDGHEVMTADKPFRQTAKMLAASGRVVIVTVAGNVNRSLTLASDRIETLQDVSARHVRASIKAMYTAEIGREDVNLIVTTPWNDLRFAFRSGRPLGEALDRLRSQASATVTRPTASVKSDLRLENLVGYGDAKVWGMTLARELDDWREGRLAWRDIDRGILLSGPPGTGKTMFAQALAATCSVKLISTSFARWQATGYLNDLLSAMQQSFETARDTTPCILFIDEIDAVGCRDRASGDSAAYQRQVVNGFLEQLDGSVARDGVVVVGATNRPEYIDQAVLRPGRLERRVEITLPNAADRASILEWHLGIEVQENARSVIETENFSGAALEALARSARRAAREAGAEVSNKFLDAVLPPTMELLQADQFRVAVHEAGHALVCKRLNAGEFRSIRLYRRVPVAGPFARGGTTEVTMSPDIVTKNRYLDHIAFLMAGMAAEIAVFDDASAGASASGNSDLSIATDIATRMVAATGLDDYLIVEELTSREALSAARRANALIWKRVDAILREQLARALSIARTEIGLLKEIASVVADRGGLTADELDCLMRPRRSSGSKSGS